MAFPAPSELFAFELGAGGSCYPRAPKGHAELGSETFEYLGNKSARKRFPRCPVSTEPLRSLAKTQHHPTGTTGTEPGRVRGLGIVRTRPGSVPVRPRTRSTRKADSPYGATGTGPYGYGYGAAPYPYVSLSAYGTHPGTPAPTGPSNRYNYSS